MKISFLIAVHNEEKLIGKVLDNLLNIPCDDYEIIVGLDGCNDKSEEIVKAYKKVKYCKLNLRKGKNAVINKLVEQASGDIIIIHDADWLFRVPDKGSLDRLIALFKSQKVGGVAEAYPIQYPLRKGAGLLERGIMIQNKLWMDYNKKKATGPLLVNIMRRRLYRKSFSLADDFERFNDLARDGYKIIVDETLELPRMITAGEEYSFKGLIKQKERTALARKQISLHFGIGFYFYVLGKCFTMGFRNLIAFSIVNLAFIIGTIKSKFNKETSTKEGWEMRGR